jgi:threonine dehydrogenase-like Zn-dependent dehydrogenase
MLAADVVSAKAQEWHTCFTLASLKGSYSIVGTYGANIAIALAKRSVDGDGNLTGTFVVNEPTAGSTTGGRTLVTGTNAGTISVNCDGTGVVTRVLTVAGVQTNQFDDFVITEAEMKDGQLIAKTIVDAQRTSSTIVSGGVFLRRTWTRVP